MMEKQKDGKFKPMWFRIPDGKCWTGGLLLLMENVFTVDLIKKIIV